MNKKYDVIIIGAGIGGLICATKLAKYGLRVLILEQHDKPGGCVTSCRKHGYNFDYGAHIFGSCNKTGIFNYCLKELQISDITFMRINPTERFVFPDQTIEVPQDLNEYISLLKDKFSDESGNIDLFFKEVLKISKNFSSHTLLMRNRKYAPLSEYKKQTFEKFLKSYFKDEKLMSVLSAQSWYLGSTASNLAAVPMCLMMVSYLRDGTYYPQGGVQTVPNSILRKFQKYGGTILFEKEVSNIRIRNNRARGVKTKDKEIFESNIVVSNGDALKTFFSLIDNKNINLAYLEKIKKMKIGSSFFLTFLGIKENLDLTKKSGWYHFSYGLNTKPENSLYIFIPSIIDNSVAPKHRHVVELAMPFPYNFSEIRDWNYCRKELRDKILEIAAKIIPGLSEAVQIEETATPKTIERYTFNTEGSASGWGMSTNQVGERRLFQETPVKNLYLTGHWTNPGGGIVPVATSGWIVADKIIRNINSKNKIAILTR